MILLHQNETGFWVATSEDVANHLGYQPGKFAPGFMVGRWQGASTHLGVFPTPEAAIAAESSVEDRCDAPANGGSGCSSALNEHMERLANDD